MMKEVTSILHDQIDIGVGLLMIYSGNEVDVGKWTSRPIINATTTSKHMYKGVFKVQHIQALYVHAM